MADLSELIERVENAAGPDRELDFWLSIKLGSGSDFTDAELQADIDEIGIENMVIDAPYTSSIDAALALVEQKLPGWAWYVEKIVGIPTRQHHCKADLWLPAQRTQGKFKERFRAGATTAPLAILAALLRALESSNG